MKNSLICLFLFLIVCMLLFLSTHRESFFNEIEREPVPVPTPGSFLKNSINNAKFQKLVSYMVGVVQVIYSQTDSTQILTLMNNYVNNNADSYLIKNILDTEFQVQNLATVPDQLTTTDSIETFANNIDIKITKEGKRKLLIFIVYFLLGLPKQSSYSLTKEEKNLFMKIIELKLDHETIVKISEHNGSTSDGKRAKSQNLDMFTLMILVAQPYVNINLY